jgi:hypothetical protein
MSKPDENDKQPDPPKLLKGLPLPDNCREVTAERIGEKFALVGPPTRRDDTSATPDAETYSAVLPSLQVGRNIACNTITASSRKPLRTLQKPKLFMPQLSSVIGSSTRDFSMRYCPLQKGSSR